MASQMPKDVEARIRALPGNTVCMDCSNLNPQWASVSYGALMCLECSGQHRSLGVHLSFVRSVAMDSWTEKQIRAMERSGGNTKLVDFFTERGISKNMQIATKYNTKQAAYYRERLTRWLDGRTEPPPDPGRYDPATGGSDAQGAEPLPGESTEAYNARQARLREDARERLRAKFGNNGMMGGVGSSPAPAQEGVDFGSLGSFVGGAASGVGSFVRNNVLENDAVRGTVGGLGQAVGGGFGALRRTVTDGDVLGTIKRNTVEEGSTVRSVLGGVGSILNRAVGGNDQPVRSMGRPPDEDDDAFFASLGMNGHKNSGTGSMPISTHSAPDVYPSANRPGATSATSQASNHRKGSSFKDDDWGDWGADSQDHAPPPEPTKEDMGRLAQELGMKLSTSEPMAPAKPAAAAPAPVARPTPTPAAAPEPAAPTSLGGGSTPVKKEKAKLQSADDFFAEFGV